MRSAGAIARWLGPGMVLALMPKCPACFVAYVAAATGMGLSLPVAAWMRGILVICSVTALLVVLIQTIRRRVWR